MGCEYRRVPIDAAHLNLDLFMYLHQGTVFNTKLLVCWQVMLSWQVKLSADIETCTWTVTTKGCQLMHRN